MNRGDVYWADLGAPAGVRPVLIVTRTSALRARSRITVAPISTSVRGIRSELTIGKDEGLRESSVAKCDDLTTIPKDWLTGRRVGRLAASRLQELDGALSFALGIPLVGFSARARISKEAEAEKDRRMVEGYTRFPPDMEDAPWPDDEQRRPHD